MVTEDELTDEECHQVEPEEDSEGDDGPDGGERVESSDCDRQRCRQSDQSLTIVVEFALGGG